MNVYDSDRMAEIVAPLGYKQKPVPDDADLIILNTCHVREKASEKLYSELGRFANYKCSRAKAGKQTIIVVAGCVAQAEGKEVLRRAPCVDIVVGPQTYQRLPKLLAQAFSDRTNNIQTIGLIDIEFPEEPKFDSFSASKKGGYSSFLTIQEGCDKFCTFCVVPYTRGSEFSRPLEKIVEEAIQMVSRGAREITLLGQNVNAYRGHYSTNDFTNVSFGRLLRELAKIPRLDILRYTTSHPLDMTEDVITAHRDIEILPPLLHLPVQSGSDKILKHMNRRHTRSDYLMIIEKLLKANPSLKFSSDFMVGFPGETEKDFDDTMKLISEIDFVQAFSFKYSPRPGTPSAQMENEISDDVKSERLLRLQNSIRKKQESFNLSCVGKVFPVLVDRLGRKPGQIAGRSPYLQPVYLNGSRSLLGKIIPLSIESATTNSLCGGLSEISSDMSFQQIERNVA